MGLSAHIVVLGMGYSATAIGLRLKALGWRVTGTTRSEATCADFADAGLEGLVFNGRDISSKLATALSQATHVLSSISPDLSLGEGGDRYLDMMRPHLNPAKLDWLGYLSTIGVYGGQNGEWVDEETPVAPSSHRTERRVDAEGAWAFAGEALDVPTGTFRLAGIYGPGRSPLTKLLEGKSRRIVKPGQVFNRIHVDDIAETVVQSALHQIGGVYNVADDEPAPPQDVIVYSAKLLGIEPPPAIAFDEAPMSEMARSFYSDNKRVKNERIKSRLGVQLLYPNYRVGLASLLKDEQILQST